MTRWLESYGYSDCVFCDIVAHKPWEPAAFVYEDEEVAVFHNVLGWVPVMLLAVPRLRLSTDSGIQGRHYEQSDLWTRMGRLGAVAVAMGRSHCIFDGQASFRLVSNFGPLALQSQQHAHLHVLGSSFSPTYPDLRCEGTLVYEDRDLRAYGKRIGTPQRSEQISAVMVVPRDRLTQDEFFGSMDRYGTRILEVAADQMGSSFRLLAEVGPHAPLPNNAAHLFILGGGWLGHYV